MSTAEGGTSGPPGVPPFGPSGPQASAPADPATSAPSEPPPGRAPAASPPARSPAAPAAGESVREGSGDSSTTVILAVTGVLVFVYFVRTILLPFVVGGIIAFVCAPLIDGIARRTHLPRWIPALIVLLVLIGLAAAIVLLGLPPLMHEVAMIAGDLKGTVEGFVRALIGNRTLNMMGATLNASSLTNYLLGAVQRWVVADSHVAELATYLVASVFGLILIWVLLGYSLFDGPQIARGMMWLVPPGHRPFVRRVWSELDPLLRRYFVGVALVVVYASTAAYIGLGIALGLQHAAFLAIITGVLEIIPLIGPAAAAIIVGLVAVQHAATTGAILAFIAYAIALRISIDQFFGPIVLGSAARVRPIVVMFCFLAGGLLFGIVGVILAVPVALTVKVVLAVLYGEPHTEPR